MPTESIIYGAQVADISQETDPKTGLRERRFGVSFSAMVPIEALLTEGAWASAMEAIRLQLLEDKVVFRTVQP